MKVILKTPEQIEGIRKSSQAAIRILKRVKNYLLPGMKTIEINKIIEAFMRKEKCIPATLGYRGFPASCCISINDGICHGVPNERIIALGDVVKIDVTTILDGYYGDTCYTWVIGPPSPEASRIVSAAKECLWAGIHAVKPNVPLGAISRAVRTTADRLGCSVVHQFCGHGVGLEFHEPPMVPYDSTEGPKWPIIRPGMTFTIEPMINLGRPDAVIDGSDGWSSYTVDGKLSAQFEHTVLVTETGVEVLTDWGDETTLSPKWKLPEEIWASR